MDSNSEHLDSPIKDIEDNPYIKKMMEDSLKGMMEVRGITLEKGFSIIQPDNTNDDLLYIQNLHKSLTNNAFQRNWITPTEFPLCPSVATEQPLNAYIKNLKKGAIITRNKYTTHFVDDFSLYNNEEILVRTHANDGIKKYSLIYITFENGMYVHEGTTFFEEIGARKYFAIEQGLEWNEGDVFDDFC